MDDFGTLFSNDVESSYEQCTGSADGDSMPRQPHLESQLQFTHAQLIPRLVKKIDDFPELACCTCSCERLHAWKSPAHRTSSMSSTRELLLTALCT